jgi:hypothetical protein
LKEPQNRNKKKSALQDYGVSKQSNLTRRVFLSIVPIMIGEGFESCLVAALVSICSYVSNRAGQGRMPIVIQYL